MKAGTNFMMMTEVFGRMGKMLAVTSGLLLAGAGEVSAAEAEFRGLWVDAYHPGMNTAGEVSNLVATARGCHANALVVEVRKRGDAYYRSGFEVMAGGVAAAFDPLAELVRQAHDTGGGQRLEVHAWMVVYPVWNVAAGVVPPPEHPYRQHADWLDQDAGGKTYDGRFHAFDPGHPAAQAYLREIALEIATRYEVDGLNLDYVHYPGKEWGYNPVAVGRFNDVTGRSGAPRVGDEAWAAFRREQVTGWVRRLYLELQERKPAVKLSAATIAWAPAPVTTADWTKKAAAYTHLYQDWRGWMEEGILDLNLPMIYVPEQQAPYAGVFRQWAEFAGAHRYQRQVVVAPGLFNNFQKGTMFQLQQLEALPPGKRPDGVCFYAYNTLTDTNGTHAKFREALVGKDEGIPGVELAPFARQAETPAMPWKTAPTEGHLRGIITGGKPANRVDSATITVRGGKERTVSSAADGFYGAAGLPPGSYQVVTARRGYQATTNECSVTAGRITTLNIQMAEAAR